MGRTSSKVPINMRADESLRNLIDEAASLMNKDRTSFILEIVRREAENIVLDQRIVKVDPSTFSAVAALLDKPMADNHSLAALQHDHGKHDAGQVLMLVSGQAHAPRAWWRSARTNSPSRLERAMDVVVRAA